MALDLDPYVKKLLNARRRVVLVNNILQNAQVGAGRGLRCFFLGGGPNPLPGADGFCYPSSPRAGAAAEAEPQRGQGDGAQESPAGGRRWLPPGPARQVRLPPRHRAGSEAAAPPPGRWDRAGAAPTAPGTAPPQAGAGIRGCSTGGDTRSPPQWGCRGCSASWGLRLLRFQGWRQGNKGWLVLGGAVWVCNAARVTALYGACPPPGSTRWGLGPPSPFAEPLL